MKQTLQIIFAIIVGIALGYLVYQFTKASPCYDGTPISQTPNYCMAGRR